MRAACFLLRVGDRSQTRGGSRSGRKAVSSPSAGNQAQTLKTNIRLVASASTPSAAAPRPPMPNARPKKRPGDGADVAGHELLRVDDDRREGRREDQPDDRAQHAVHGQVRVGQREGERQHAENRSPDHVLAPDTVTDRAAEHRAGRHRAEKHEQVQLRAAHRHVERLDQIEGVVGAEARQVDVLREDEHQQQRQRAGHLRRASARGAARAPRRAPRRRRRRPSRCTSRRRARAA